MVNMSGHCITEIWLVRLRKRIFNFIRLYLIYALQLHIASIWASLVAQLVKNPPSMQKTWVQSLGWENSMEEAMATHSSILAWRIPTDRGALQAILHGVTKSQTKLRDKHTHKYSQLGLPGGASGKEPACQYRRYKRHRFNPWVRKTS